MIYHIRRHWLTSREHTNSTQKCSVLGLYNKAFCTLAAALINKVYWAAGVPIYYTHARIYVYTLYYMYTHVLSLAVNKYRKKHI